MGSSMSNTRRLRDPFTGLLIRRRRRWGRPFSVVPVSGTEVGVDGGAGAPSVGTEGRQTPRGRVYRVVGQIQSGGTHFPSPETGRQDDSHCRGGCWDSRDGASRDSRRRVEGRQTVVDESLYLLVGNRLRGTVSPRPRASSVSPTTVRHFFELPGGRPRLQGSPRSLLVQLWTSPFPSL